MIKTCGDCRYFDPKIKHKDIPANMGGCVGGFYKGAFVAPDAICCPDFTQELTVFQQITASPEVLAEKLTYWQYDPDQSSCGWTNNVIVGELYKNYHEAIAATVKKLKEVCDD